MIGATGKQELGQCGAGSFLLAPSMSVFFTLCELMSICVTTECLPGREHHVTAVAGSVVSFNCTLEVNFSAHRVRWVHHSPSYGPVGYVIWYNGGRYNPFVESRGVSVEDNATHGWSVLTIPRVRLEDHGRFQCFVFDLEQQYQVNFQLSVTGNNYIICCNMYVISKSHS